LPGQPLESTPNETDLLLARLAVSGVPIPARGCMDLHLGVAEEKEFEEWIAKEKAEKLKTETLKKGSMVSSPSDGKKEDRSSKIEDGSGQEVRSSKFEVRSSQTPNCYLLSPISSPFVAFGPGSKMPAKRWPIERFAEVGQSLIDRFDIWPIVFGGAEDADDAEFLLRVWGRGYNAAGQLSVRASAFALKQCLLYVGNDTGAMHLAASVGVPCVAIFSAREWRGMWHPYGPGHHVLRAAIDCEGCGLVECLERKNECLARITTAQVLEACEEVLKRKVDSKQTLKS